MLIQRCINVAQGCFNVISMLFQRRGPTLYQRCGTLKTDVEFSFIFNVESTLFQCWSTTLIRLGNAGWVCESIEISFNNDLKFIELLLAITWPKIVQNNLFFLFKTDSILYVFKGNFRTFYNTCSSEHLPIAGSGHTAFSFFIS